MEWNVALLASSAAVESVNSELTALSNDIFIKAGDTIQFSGGIYINGTLTASATKIAAFIPISRPIVATKATLISGGIQFRQNGQYYLGDSSEQGTNILSLGGTVDAFITVGGINLRINSKTNTGAQNNAPIAILFTNLKFQFLQGG